MILCSCSSRHDRTSIRRLPQDDQGPGLTPLNEPRRWEGRLARALCTRCPVYRCSCARCIDTASRQQVSPESEGPGTSAKVLVTLFRIIIRIHGIRGPQGYTTLKPKLNAVTCGFNWIQPTAVVGIPVNPMNPKRTGSPLCWVQGGCEVE